MQTRSQTRNSTRRNHGIIKRIAKPPLRRSARRSVRQLATALNQMDIVNDEIPAGTRSLTIPDEDTEMVVESIDFIHEEELDDEQYNFEVTGLTFDQRWRSQPNDGFDSSDEEIETNESSSDSDDEEEEILLLSLTPVTIAVSSEDDGILQPATGKRAKVAPQNPRGKYATHSPDLMRRTLIMKAMGQSYRKLEEEFGVPRSTICDHKHRSRNRGGNAEPIHNKGGGSTKITSAGSKFLVDTVTEFNTLTLHQLRYLYFQHFNDTLDASTIYRHLVNKCRFTIKRTLPYPERRTSDDIKNQRAEYIEKYVDSGDVKYEKNCVFVDEAHVMANMRRNYGWAPVTKTPHVMIPKMYARSRSMLAAISHFGIVEVCLKVNKPGKGGGTRAHDFRAFLDLVMDELDKRGLQDRGWNIVCDNASIHKAGNIAFHVIERGYRIVYLPPYSPVLNPIELFFSKVKLLFRHVDPERQLVEPTIESQNHDLEQRLIKAMSKVTPQDCIKWIEHSMDYFGPCRSRQDDL